jgi:hypothetical protein
MDEIGASDHCPLAIELTICRRPGARRCCKRFDTELYNKKSPPVSRGQVGDPRAHQKRTQHERIAIYASW